MFKNNSLKFWVMPNAGFNTGKILEQEIYYFNKRNPDIKIEFTIIPWSHTWNKLIDITKGRQTTDLPDIVQVGNTWIPTLIYLGCLAKISSDSDNFFYKNFISQLWESCVTDEGKNIYAIPWFSDIRVLYYRRDIFDKLGIDFNNLENWEVFISVCEKLKRQDVVKIHPMSLAGQKETILIHDLAPWIWAGGGDIINEKAKKGIDYYFQLLNRKYIMLKSQVSPAYTGDFFSGNYAMQISGVWPISSFFNPEHPDYNDEVSKNFSMAVLPEGPSGRHTYIGGSCLAVTKFCRNIRSAEKFIEFLSTSNSQARHASSIGMLPAKEEVLDIFFSPQQEEVRNVFKKSINIARTLPNTITLGTLEQQFTRFSDRLLNAVKNGRYNKKVLNDEFLVLSREINLIAKYIGDKNNGT